MKKAPSCRECPGEVQLEEFAMRQEYKHPTWHVHILYVCPQCETVHTYYNGPEKLLEEKEFNAVYYLGS